MKTLFTFLTVMICSAALLGQAYPDRHSTLSKDAWVSCETAESPNVKRDPGHWIMYDLGDQYALHGSTFWNNNAPTETDRGLNQIVVDYSLDGANWQEVTTMSLPQAPGSSFYQGTEGPDFGGATARYVLISAMSNHGGDCYSLSEVRINAAIATTTSFADDELDLDLSISPNPASENVQVEMNRLPDGNVKYQITDMAGRLYNNGSVRDRILNLDVSDLPTGTYTITLYNEEGLKSELLNIISQ